ncbi:hypothetical protein FGD71_036485 [Streptomyces sporangiiformans]|uniref:Uncharacterized protein n=1 Tax=Streptomyces sporangiiformans TaxID=2315329 RepID=A0A505D154_9ACTN|nr:hypothetical protein FGD71_036485 [Streptomyces sporangiiformans]
MPSLTVVVSSDTDICFSPGLYGDCLPTGATDGAADSFRAEHVSFGSRFSLLMLAHAIASGKRPVDNPVGAPSGFTSHRRYGHRQRDVKRL